MTERDRWGLRGPVKRIEVQRTWSAPRCTAAQCDVGERGDTSVAEFRADGALVDHRGRNPDGSEHAARYEYDSAGRLVAVMFTDSTGSAMVRRHEYDASGRLLRSVERDRIGQDRLAETYEYSASGSRTKVTLVDPSTNRSAVTAWAVDGSDAFYSAPGAVSLRTVYDERDLVTELLFLDDSGATLARVEFLYDTAGRLVEEVHTQLELLPAAMISAMKPADVNALRALMGGEGGVSRRLHTYDANGRRIETVSALFGPLGRERQTMAYNEHGDRVEERSESEHRQMNIDDEGRLTDDPAGPTTSLSEARFEYEYDERGNWLRKTVRGRNAADGDFAVTSTEQRAIAYFD
jgi:YD repeat-containing protein